MIKENRMKRKDSKRHGGVLREREVSKMQLGKVIGGWGLALLLLLGGGAGGALAQSASQGSNGGPNGTPAAPLSVVGKTTTTTATIVTLTAATSAQLIAANATRKGLRWMNIGTNPVTVVIGAGPAVVGNGMAYSGAAGTGQQGGSEAFEGTAVPGDQMYAISTLGTTIIVWEQN
jgi:hypothetical protein